MAEGRKDRPCVIVLAMEDRDGDVIVTVAPVTHSPPSASADGVELPPATKARLGLDEKRSWVLSTEVNRFTWPGPDLRPISRARPGVFAYGLVPAAFLQQLRQQIVARGGVGMVRRDDDDA